MNAIRAVNPTPGLSMTTISDEPRHFSRRDAEAAEVPGGEEIRMIILGRFFSRFSQVQSPRLTPKDKEALCGLCVSA